MKIVIFLTINQFLDIHKNSADLNKIEINTSIPFPVHVFEAMRLMM